MANIYPIYTTVEEEPKTICRQLEETVFEYPFFDEGVLSTKTTLKGQCNLDTIDLDNKEGLLELKGLIFNTSHCGSTLLCNMLNQVQKVKVVSESEAINGLLLSKKLYSLPDEKIKTLLRRIIQLYQQEVEAKQYLIIKLTSWNVYFINLILEVFPKTKWIFLNRETEALVKSLMKNKRGFIDWWDHPVDILRKHFIEPGREIKNKEEYLREMIRGHRAYANSQKNSNGLFIEYPTFIEEYEAILKHFDLEPTEKEEALLKEVVKYDSKLTEKKLWQLNKS